QAPAVPALSSIRSMVRIARIECVETVRQLHRLPFERVKMPCLPWAAQGTAEEFPSVFNVLNRCGAAILSDAGGPAGYHRVNAERTSHQGGGFQKIPARMIHISCE